MYTHLQATCQANPRPVLAQRFQPRSPYKPFAFLFKGVGKGYGFRSVGRKISLFYPM